MPETYTPRTDPEGPDPTYIGTHRANRDVCAHRDRTRIGNKAAFERAVPEYDQSITPWHDHWEAFIGCLYAHPVSDRIAKNILYRRMKPETFGLISEEYAPWSDRLFDYNLTQYGEVLMKLFQPPNESKSLKMTYLERKQSPDEHYETYVHQKYKLWKRSHAENARDYDELFTQLTNGLYNKRARLYMRRYRTTCPPDIGDYLIELGHKQNELREKFMAGEISFVEIKGMESREAYRETRRAKFRIKNEVQHLSGEINSVGRNFRPNKSRYADKECYACHQKGHIRSECPRAMSGLATNALSVVSEEDTQYYSDDEYDSECAAAAPVCQLRPRQRSYSSRRPGTRTPPPSKNRFQKKVTFNKSAYRNRRVVAEIVENDDGHFEILHLENGGSDHDEDQDQPQHEGDDEDTSDEAVHFLA